MPVHIVLDAVGTGARSSRPSMIAAVKSKRTALAVGGTGLVGRALLSLLLAHDQYRHVHLLVRRKAPRLPPSARPKLQTIDFAELASWTAPMTDDVFIALGTTIKVAGSEEAFCRVNLDPVVDAARTGLAAGAKRLVVVSPMGADG